MDGHPGCFLPHYHGVVPGLVHTSAELLEFSSVLEMLRAYAASPLGRARIAALAPRGPESRQWMEQQLRLAEELRRFWRTGARFLGQLTGDFGVFRASGVVNSDIRAFAGE